MRLLILGDAASVHTLKWVRSLTEQGVEIQLVSLYTNVEPGIQALVDAGKIHVHLGEQGYAGSFASRAFLRRVRFVRGMVRSWKPNVVHAYYASSYGLLGALSGARIYTISVWGSDVYAFPKRGEIFKRILSFSLGRASRVFSTSEAMAEETRKYTSTPLTVIPFGVDTDALAHPNRVLHTPFVFGTIKSLAPIYGIDVLIRAFDQVRRLADREVRLLLVGGGPQEAELKALARSLKMSGWVEFTGAVPHAQVQPCLERMDVFCALSREESFGVAIVEAMASGLPVVVSDAPGPAEIVSDGHDGYVVPRESVDAAAQAMLKLLEDETWNRFAGNAAQSARNKYHWPQNVQAQMDAYASLLEG